MTTNGIDSTMSSGRLSSGKSPPTKPQRPLSAYNLFFRLERERILSGCASHEGESDDELRTASVSGGTKICAEDVAKISDEKRYGVVRRQDRKKHGKIGFAELAKLIAKKWKSISEAEKSLLQERAAEEKRKYKEQLKDYAKKMKEHSTLKPKQETPLPFSATTGPKGEQEAPSVARDKFPRCVSSTDRGNTSYHGQNQNQNMIKPSMVNHPQDELICMLQQQPQLRAMQQEQLNAEASMIQREQESMVDWNLFTRDSRSVASYGNAVDIFDMATNDPISIGSYSSCAMLQQASSLDCDRSIVQPLMPCYTYEEEHYQIQPKPLFQGEFEEICNNWIPQAATVSDQSETFSDLDLLDRMGTNFWTPQI